MSLAAWQQPPLLRPPPGFRHPPNIPLTPTYVVLFPFREGKPRIMTAPAHSRPTHLGSYTPWQQLATNMTFACHLHPSSGSLAPSSPSSPRPNAGWQLRSTAHLGLAPNSLWPVHSAFLGGGSPFWASASSLCNVGTRRVDLRDCLPAGQL